eukprot:CAMPEP_0167777520 /NCGR_PEP_ID=MMETSP0111_2-20121227/3749_1 /TAXON_ID=91324 /ORGANISM="Lotharella globosa, Strain CCCM811" /LENGTH=1505 /DNA_ID=CAMNT_0007667733 /DNA_START=315 /DNA_END=4832 /DNA_ORIENTATION=-
MSSELFQLDDQVPLDDAIVEAYTNAAGNEVIGLFSKSVNNGQPFAPTAIVQYFINLSPDATCSISRSIGNGPFTQVTDFLPPRGQEVDVYNSCADTSQTVEVYVATCNGPDGFQQNYTATLNDMIGCEGAFNPFLIMGSAVGQMYPLQLVVPRTTCDAGDTCQVQGGGGNPTVAPTQPPSLLPTNPPSLLTNPPSMLPTNPPVGNPATEKVIFLNNIRTNLAICFKYAADSQSLDTYIPTPLKFAEYAEVTITASMLAVGYFFIDERATVCSDANVLPAFDFTTPRETLALVGPTPLDDSIVEAYTDLQGNGFIGLFRKDFTDNGQPLQATSIVQYFINLSPDVFCSVSRQVGTGQMVEIIPLLGSRNEDVDIFTSCEDTTQTAEMYLFQCSGENQFSKNFTVNLNSVLGCEGAFNPFIVMGSAVGTNFPLQLVRPREACGSEDATCRVQGGITPTQQPISAPPTVTPTVPPTAPPSLPPTGAPVQEKVLFLNNIRTNFGVCFKYAIDSQTLDTYVPTPLRFSETAEVTMTVSLLAVEMFLVDPEKTTCSDDTIIPSSDTTTPRQVFAIGGSLDDSIVEGFTDSRGSVTINLFNRNVNSINDQPPPPTAIVQYFMNLSPNVFCSVSRTIEDQTKVLTVFLPTRNQYVDVFESCDATSRKAETYVFSCNGEQNFQQNLTIVLSETLGCEGAFNPFILMGSPNSTQYPLRVIRPERTCAPADVCTVGTAPPTQAVVPTMAPSVTTIPPTPSATAVRQKVIFLNNIRTSLPLCFKYGADTTSLTTYVPTPLNFAESSEIDITVANLAVEFFFIDGSKTQCTDQTILQGVDSTKPRTILFLAGGTSDIDDSIVEASTDAQGKSNISLFRKEGTLLPSTAVVQYFINLSPNTVCGFSRQIGSGSMEQITPLLPYRADATDVYNSCADTSRQPETYVVTCTGSSDFNKNVTVTLDSTLGCEGAYNPFMVMGSMVGTQYPLQLVRPRSSCDPGDACLVQAAPTAMPVGAPTMPSVQPTMQPIGGGTTQKVLFLNNIPVDFALCFKIGTDKQTLDTYVPQPLRFSESYEVVITAATVAVDAFLIDKSMQVCNDSTIIPGVNTTKPRTTINLGPTSFDDSIIEAYQGPSATLTINLFKKVTGANGEPLPYSAIVQYFINLSPDAFCSVNQKIGSNPSQQIVSTLTERQEATFVFNTCADTSRAVEVYDFRCEGPNNFTKSFQVTLDTVLGCEGAFNPFLIMGSAQSSLFPLSVVRPDRICAETTKCKVEAAVPTQMPTQLVPSVPTASPTSPLVVRVSYSAVFMLLDFSEMESNGDLDPLRANMIQTLSNAFNKPSDMISVTAIKPGSVVVDGEIQASSLAEGDEIATAMKEDEFVFSSANGFNTDYGVPEVSASYEGENTEESSKGTSSSSGDEGLAESTAAGIGVAVIVIVVVAVILCGFCCYRRWKLKHRSEVADESMAEQMPDQTPVDPDMMEAPPAQTASVAAKKQDLAEEQTIGHGPSVAEEKELAQV